ncbi:MAG: insulinase family protein [Rhodomicrobium sp.]|nr:insulinase family protein [Rhodomicrobium sp.]
MTGRVRSSAGQGSIGGHGRFGIGFLLSAAVLAALAFFSANAGWAQQAPVGKVTSFTLDNGLQIVVIEDRRVPVVTHMVWYKIGAIDDPQGKSGLAHLLEHLMFKSFDADAPETFAQRMSRLGAVDNARTDHDTTSYFQRVAKESLGEVMAIEAKRMSGLTLREKEVLVERDVVREERRANFESDPIKLLAEQLMAALHVNHSYARPRSAGPRRSSS